VEALASHWAQACDEIGTGTGKNDEGGAISVESMAKTTDPKQSLSQFETNQSRWGEYMIMAAASGNVDAMTTSLAQTMNMSESQADALWQATVNLTPQQATEYIFNHYTQAQINKAFNAVPGACWADPSAYTTNGSTAS